MSMVLVLSTMIAVSSSSWMMVWMSLEMNTLALCSMMTQKTAQMKKNNSSTFLYICVQSATSVWILLSLCQESHKMSFLLILAVGMKMGSWPLHSWYLSLIDKMSIKQNTLLLVMTWQKIIPLAMISMMSKSAMETTLIISLAMMSVAAPLCSLNSNLSMKSFLATSSINNNGWLMVNSLSSLKMLSIFLTLYSMSLKLMFELVKDMKKKNMMKTPKAWMVVLIVANMSGLPPLTMFWAKIMVLKTLLSKNSSTMLVICTTLIMSACYLLYYYLWTTNGMMIESPLKSQNPMMEKNFKTKMMCGTLLMSAASCTMAI